VCRAILRCLWALSDKNDDHDADDQSTAIKVNKIRQNYRTIHAKDCINVYPIEIVILGLHSKYLLI